MSLFTEQMPSVIKMVPVLEAPKSKAEQGALRAFGASLARCYRRLIGIQHVSLLMKIKDQVQSAFYFKTKRYCLTQHAILIHRQ